ncbi:hypothetical protein IFM89_014709 [Coptis chinensis]|uniref:Uncharacterized protein n=1 Tax=Coptis chinensis TaxID=261450 RepID=A0A835LJC8_9MAGN|nr:hypothetical protein IFM89_014709 [Coptis chinensis]
MSRFKRLADGPSFSAKSYNSFSINGYVFSTYDSEVNMTTQNSGVSMKAFTNFRASAKDKNLVEDEATYYGVVNLDSIMSQSGSDHESDYEENDSQPEENESQHEESEPEPTGPKMQVQFNSKGQPVGPGSAQFVYFIGRMARICLSLLMEWCTFFSKYNDAIKAIKAMVYGRDGKGRVRGLGTSVTKTVIHADVPYKKTAEEEKRKREITDENVRLVMQCLDEESTARKILQEKMEVYVHDHSELGSISQARRSPHVSPFTRCLLKNFRKRTVALGSVSSDVISTDSYSITIDDIFDYTAELYVGEGTLADISIGDTITWPKTFVESI